MKIHYLQNDPLVGPGSLEAWVKEKGLSLTSTQLYEEANFPSFDEFDLLVILGGTMGAYDEDKFSWIYPEKVFIREAINRHKFVLGICLGAQLMADALGGRAYPHTHKEIGWWSVQLDEHAAKTPLFNGLPNTFTAFEWHGDTFDLPEGAIRLAASEGCQNQAFVYGDCAIGLQFHPESTEVGIHQLIEHHGHELVDGPYLQKPDDLLNQSTNVEQGRLVLYTLLDNFKSHFDKQNREQLESTLQTMK